MKRAAFILAAALFSAGPAAAANGSAPPQASHARPTVAGTTAAHRAAGPAPAPAAAAPASPPAAAPALQVTVAVEPCATCHDQPAAWSRKKTVHPPVRSSQCLACHSPHASRHPFLVRRGGTRTCLGCHADLAAVIRAGTPHGALSLEKGCLSCHDPHASDRPNLLVEEPAKLCASCHEDIVKEAAAAHPHPPASAGNCLACHDPHAAPRPSLAKKDQPELCAACHRLTDAKIVAAHKQVPIGRARCSSCHAPHGSASAGMIRPRAHPPFAEGDCETCHGGPKPSIPSGAAVIELCTTCHEPRTSGHVIPAGVACVGCHTPHASSSAAPLIAGREKIVCLACHKDVAAQRAGAVAFHPAVGGSQDCTGCHELHTGKTPALLKKSDAHSTCLTCHSAHAQFAHPMGEGVADPSHPGRSVGCLSCHNPHGTSFPQFLLADPRQDLCMRCHAAGSH